MSSTDPNDDSGSRDFACVIASEQESLVPQGVRPKGKRHLLFLQISSQ